MPRRAAVAGPNAILICLESHFVGAFGFYPAGAPIKRSNISDYSAPYWSEDGLDVVEQTRLRQALQGTPAPVAQPEPTLMVEAKRAFTATFNSVVGVAAAQTPTMFSVSVGDRMPASHPLVQRHPDAFQPVDD